MDTRATTTDHEGLSGLWVLLAVVGGGIVLMTVLVSAVLAIRGVGTKTVVEPTSTVTVASPVYGGPVAGSDTLPTQFTDGEYIVGQDIAPGNYRTQGGANCYWERLSNPNGGFTGIISNGEPTSPTTVRVLASDKAFNVKGGCLWVLVD